MASWKLWEMAARPSFAREVVGQDIDKDDEDTPAIYLSTGVKELVLFDPHATPRSRRRVRWQVFRKLKSRGLVGVDVSNGDRVRSTVLGCWLRAVEHRGRLSVRLATGVPGDLLRPTETEAAMSLAEQERAAREQAEAEVTRLRAALAALKTPAR